MKKIYRTFARVREGVVALDFITPDDAGEIAAVVKWSVPNGHYESMTSYKTTPNTHGEYFPVQVEYDDLTGEIKVLP